MEDMECAHVPLYAHQGLGTAVELASDNGFGDNNVFTSTSRSGKRHLPTG